MKTRLACVTAALLLTACWASSASAQGQMVQSIQNHVNHTKANALGGSNCGRGISQAEAEAAWANYCFEDCTLQTGGGCGGGRGCGTGCGGGGLLHGRVSPMRGGGAFGCGGCVGASNGAVGFGNRSGCGCSSGGRSGGGLLSRVRSAGCGHSRCGLFSGSRSGGDFPFGGNGFGNRGCAGAAGGCDNGCFGWPSARGNSSGCGCGNGSGGGLFSRLGQGRDGGCGCGRGCGGGLFAKLHGRVHSRDNGCGGNVCSGLDSCGNRGGFFNKFVGADYGCGDVQSRVRGCGCGLFSKLGNRGGSSGGCDSGCGCDGDNFNSGCASAPTAAPVPMTAPAPAATPVPAVQ